MSFLKHMGLLTKFLCRLRLRSAQTVATIMNPQSPHAAIKMAAIHAHQLGRAGDVSFCLFQFSLDELAMVSVCRLLERRKPERCDRGLLFSSRGQIAGINLNTRMHDHHALNSI